MPRNGTYYGLDKVTGRAIELMCFNNTWFTRFGYMIPSLKAVGYRRGIRSGDLPVGFRPLYNVVVPTLK